MQKQPYSTEINQVGSRLERVNLFYQGAAVAQQIGLRTSY